MPSAANLPIRYWLRSVRIGLLVTILVIAVLILLPFLPHQAEFQMVPYLGVLVAGAAGGLVVALLPWQRLFERGLGVYFLYGWSAADILLVSAGIAVTGGGRSEMFLIYGLTTAFFGASYPLVGQAGLLAFTFVCYLIALAATGWEVDPAGLLARLSSLAILTILTSFLSRELMAQMGAQERSRNDAERWAALLSTVAGSAHSMTLDPERVFEVALDSIIGLGFHRGAICELDEDGRTYRVVQAHGLPSEEAERLDPAALAVTSLALQTGNSVLVDDERWPGALPLVHDAGLVAMVATPIWAENGSRPSSSGGAGSSGTFPIGTGRPSSSSAPRPGWPSRTPGSSKRSTARWNAWKSLTASRTTSWPRCLTSCGPRSRSSRVPDSRWSGCGSRSTTRPAETS